MAPKRAHISGNGAQKTLYVTFALHIALFMLNMRRVRIMYFCMYVYFCKSYAEKSKIFHTFRWFFSTTRKIMGNLSPPPLAPPQTPPPKCSSMQIFFCQRLQLVVMHIENRPKKRKKFSWNKEKKIEKKFLSSSIKKKQTKGQTLCKYLRYLRVFIYDFFCFCYRKEKC